MPTSEPESRSEEVCIAHSTKSSPSYRAIAINVDCVSTHIFELEDDAARTPHQPQQPRPMRARRATVEMAFDALRPDSPSRARRLRDPANATIYVSMKRGIAYHELFSRANGVGSVLRETDAKVLPTNVTLCKPLDERKVAQ